MSNQRYSDEELLGFLRGFYEQFGKRPIPNDFRRNKGIPHNTLYNWRGLIWLKSIKMAGIPYKHHCKDLPGSRTAGWRGGRIRYGSTKYIYIYCPNHPFAISVGYVAEHRLNMEKKIGRYLTKKEVVHHKDENNQNNHIKNLQLMTWSEHRQYHKEKNREYHHI